MNLPDIAKRMRASDNRATALPIFVVEQKRRIYGVDLEYTDDYVFVDDDGEEVEYEDCLDGECGKLGYTDVYEFVTVFFSEKGASDYIEANAHNLNSPRVFVYSGHRNEEWKEVRNYLLEVIK